MQDSKISGADEPSAISVKLATVSFHTLTVLLRPVAGSFSSFFLDVMRSIAHMKMS
jgi:hypothetical protein